MNYQFKPKWWVILLTIALALIFVRLGLWQLSRANEKELRQERIEQYAREPVIKLPTTLIKLEDFQYRQVEVRGSFIEDHAIYLDNKIYQGVAGYEILVPIKIANSSLHILVNRGWIAAGTDRLQLPAVYFPRGEVTVTGMVASPMIKAVQLSEEITADKLWINLDFELYQKVTGLALQPILLLQQDNHIDDGLIRQWVRPDSGASKNIGYAIQWFLLAATICIIFLILNVKRNSSKK
ncbi:SURF1 family protein [Nitrosomonas sp. Nm132]|jgi:surfeit locus 1 family protein|uniref:SURF1 family protein n=1 Tax=Nitrosomonas sp. Nm132 TaxID=1881053 RepID=UPI0008883E5B|nr:SURF1 family protein [Nitrosomonas sp. Nm132]SDH37774.1 surfeit locus 1 family protein [Nitrosomonas sp. Nm132]